MGQRNTRVAFDSVDVRNTHDDDQGHREVENEDSQRNSFDELQFALLDPAGSDAAAGKGFFPLLQLPLLRINRPCSLKMSERPCNLPTW